MSEQTQSDVIAASELQFRYARQNTWQLDIPQFHVPAGEHTYVFGPSGCGKTTLLQLIAGVLAPNQGSLQILGESLHTGRRRDQRRAELMGFVFQSFNLVPHLSAVDNIVLPCRFAPQRRSRAIGNGGSLIDEAHRLLERLGLSATLGERKPSELSVGQQQRVAVARALIGRPPLIVCDEPTSALDPEARDRFVELLLDECAAADSTAVVVSHDPSIRGAFRASYDLTPLPEKSVLRSVA
ncbi:MAG: ABC transporter ATP-binding protein [Myxococcota bacterium]